jgi:hypothetical protein
MAAKTSTQKQPKVRKSTFAPSYHIETCSNRAQKFIGDRTNLYLTLCQICLEFRQELAIILPFMLIWRPGLSSFAHRQLHLISSETTQNWPPKINRSIKSFVDRTEHPPNSPLSPRQIFFTMHSPIVCSGPNPDQKNAKISLCTPLARPDVLQPC